MQGEDAIRQMARELYQEGVAAFLPTTMSASVEDTRRVIAAVRRVMDAPEQRAARVLGAHMEAPFLSPEKAGAQRKEFFLHPSWEAFLDLTGGDIQAVRVITMAPELPGAEEFIRKAAENGILIKSAQSLELMGRVNTVVLDKTGTVTQGKPRLTDCLAAEGVTEEELLCVAASVEQPSEHPLSRAVTEAAQERSIPLCDVEDFAAVPGGGVHAALHGETVFAGNADYMRQNGVPIDAFSAQADRKSTRLNSSH